MVLESIAAIHAKKKGSKSDKYRQTLNFCQILENHQIKLILSRYGFFNRYFDIYFFSPIRRRCGGKLSENLLLIRHGMTHIGNVKLLIRIIYYFAISYIHKGKGHCRN